MMRSLIKGIMIALVIFLVQPASFASANYFTVTPGVEYKKSDQSWNNKAQSIQTIEVDLKRPNVTVDVLIPNPLHARTRLTNLLKNNSYEGHRPVAGINAAFYHMNSGAPAYLLSSGGKVNTYGVISTGNNEFMSVPTAFGMTQEGKGMIGQFSYEATAEIAGVPLTITNINKERGTNEAILYTPTYSYSSTRASQYGIEFVLTNFSSPLEEGYELGKQITAKVSAITPYNSRDSTIPKNGAVISIHGGSQAAAFSHVKVGDEVKLSIDLKQPWKDAKFVLASGPLLVQNGRVNMTINPNSSRAREVHPRTAVAINEDGSKVFFVTVDGRRSGSVGMNLNEFSNYLVSIGAHAALNLDGGGSTTMAVRKRGDLYPTVFNRPSDNYERAISAAIGAVSLTTTGEARTIEAELTGPSTLLKGGTTAVRVKSGLDTYFNPVAIDRAAVTYSLDGDIGSLSSTGVFTAMKAGKGTIHATFEGAKQSFPIEVVNEPAAITIEGVDEAVGSNDTVQLKARAYDAKGKELSFSSDLVQWAASSSLGTITNEGLLKANVKGSGMVTATIGSKSVSKRVNILSGGQLLHSFEQASAWESDSIRSTTSVRFEGKGSPLKDGENALKLTYDFREYKEGTSASYAVAKRPLEIKVKPTYLGLWVFGDRGGHWLRGQITDGKGAAHTIDFTRDGGLNWQGWKYVKATIPAHIEGPIQLNRIYIAEPNANKKNSGAVYFDRLLAEYGNDHEEQLFNDLPLDYKAAEEIAYATNKGWILGDIDGKFYPDRSISRAHAAVLISRVLKLPAGNHSAFTDVPKSHRYYKEISAVVEAGIMSGKNETTFDPEGNLTRAQMAKVLVNSYQLTAHPSSYEILKDVPRDFWAFDDIHVLRANRVTIVEDGNYRPFEYVKRYQIAAFLTRIDRR